MDPITLFVVGATLAEWGLLAGASVVAGLGVYGGIRGIEAAINYFTADGQLDAKVLTKSLIKQYKKNGMKGVKRVLRDANLKGTKFGDAVTTVFSAANSLKPSIEEKPYADMSAEQRTKFVEKCVEAYNKDGDKGVKKLVNKHQMPRAEVKRVIRELGGTSAQQATRAAKKPSKSKPRAHATHAANVD